MLLVLEACGAIVMLTDLVAVFPVASLTVNPKVLVPAFTGVPEIFPDVANPGLARPVLQDPEQELTVQV